MKSSLFITGAGGFLGRHLLAELDFSAYESVICLDRRLDAIQLPEPEPSNLRCIEADLLDAGGYEAYLKPGQSVIHLAAVTGKVKPAVYQKINVEATDLLLAACRRAGVSHFLFLSSIAAGFRKIDRYHYAYSKIEGEKRVRESGLRFTILRPTMIMGPESPVFKGFDMLAGLPVIPVFGPGDTALQPIHACDVARGICQIDKEGRYHGEVLELGGPKPVSSEGFLRLIAGRKGRSPRVVHLPMGLTAWGLSLLERVVYGMMPFTLGQLATFRNDGTAAPSTLHEALLPDMIGLDQIISDSQTKAPQAEKTPHSRECRVLTRYLTGQAPSPYVLRTYERCTEKVAMEPGDFHDRFLLLLARIHPVFTRTADAYSRFFRPLSMVRKRLAYLAAILEVSPGHFRFYDSTDGHGLVGFILGLGVKGVSLALHLLFSAPILLPLQLLARLTGGPGKQPPRGEEPV